MTEEFEKTIRRMNITKLKHYCRNNIITGFSGKKKEYIIQLILDDNNSTIKENKKNNRKKKYCKECGKKLKKSETREMCKKCSNDDLSNFIDNLK